MAEILIGERRTQTDIYQFQVSSDGQLSNRSNSRDATIEFIFENGHFAGVREPIEMETGLLRLEHKGRFFDRKTWQLFGAISEKIVELEKRYYHIPFTILP